MIHPNNEISLQWRESALSPNRIYWNETGNVEATSEFVDVSGLTTYTFENSPRNKEFYFKSLYVKCGVN